jgi:hypothetical protein
MYKDVRVNSFFSEDMIERVLSGKFKKVYSKDEVKDWVNFGVKMDFVDRTDKKGIVNWVKLLNGKNINL